MINIKQTSITLINIKKNYKPLIHIKHTFILLINIKNNYKRLIHIKHTSIPLMYVKTIINFRFTLKARVDPENFTTLQQLSLFGNGRSLLIIFR